MRMKQRTWASARCFLRHVVPSRLHSGTAHAFLQDNHGSPLSAFAGRLVVLNPQRIRDAVDTRTLLQDESALPVSEHLDVLPGRIENGAYA
jgi:hypothetical protein